MNPLRVPNAAGTIGNVDVAGNLYFDSIGVGCLEVFSDRVEFEKHTIHYDDVEKANLHLDRFMFLNNFRLDLLVGESQFVFNFRLNKSDAEILPANWDRSKNNRWFVNTLLIYTSGSILAVLFSVLNSTITK